MLQHHLEKNTYAIYQLKHIKSTRDLRFEPFKKLQASGKTVDANNYDLVYVSGLPNEHTATLQQILDDLYFKFNIDHPADFTGHSLSTSDVIAINLKGDISYHYVDQVGFQRLINFNLNHIPKESVRHPDDTPEGDSNLVHNANQTANHYSTSISQQLLQSSKSSSAKSQRESNHIKSKSFSL